MRGNTLGKAFCITTFGESHGEGIGVVIDGCPAGLVVDFEAIQSDLDRRRPGQSSLTTPRKESDRVEILSGIFEGKATGAPICMFLRNTDARSGDYSHLEQAFRPSHADFTYSEKYGIRDHRGGGRSSARETAARVAAGSIAKQFLRLMGISIWGYVQQVGHVRVERSYSELSPEETERNLVRCPDPEKAQEMVDLIEEVKQQNDTIGGHIRCVCFGVPAGLGEPVFDKLHADLGKAMLSINAVKGFQIGEGFGSAWMRGSAHNDAFLQKEGRIGTATNHSGGIQGGISNGEDIWFDVAFKPVSTLMKPQQSVNADGEEIVLDGVGRHDPCVLPRAVPIVEAMAALVLADHMLRSRMDKTNMNK